jgi:uncharacterized membrane protein
MSKTQRTAAAIFIMGRRIMGFGAASFGAAEVVRLFDGSTTDPVYWVPTVLLGVWVVIAIWFGFFSRNGRAALFFVLIGLSLLVHSLTQVVVPSDLTQWVLPSELVLLSAVGWTAMQLPGLKHNLSIMPAIAATIVVFLLFGVIHLAHAELVGSLVPSWIPQPCPLPWISGSVLCLASIAMLFAHLRWFALTSVAAMFSLWIVLIHATRLIAKPADPFEWSFAAMAFALTGALLLLAAGLSQTLQIEPRLDSDR